jgi:hypothetical protein
MKNEVNLQFNLIPRKYLKLFVFQEKKYYIFFFSENVKSVTTLTSVRSTTVAAWPTRFASTPMDPSTADLALKDTSEIR